MEIHTLFLLGLGGLLSLIGGIMTLVAAFRQNIWWGVGCLLLAPVNLVFTVLHWTAAKKGFFVWLAGFGAVGLGLATSPMLRSLAGQVQKIDFTKVHATGLQPTEPAATKPDLNAQIQERRNRLEQLEAKFTLDGEALVRQFQKLTEQRKALKPGDTAAVAAFNVEAAAYQAQNTARQQASQEIATLRAELDPLLAQRSLKIP